MVSRLRDPSRESAAFHSVARAAYRRTTLSAREMNAPAVRSKQKDRQDKMPAHAGGALGEKVARRAIRTACRVDTDEPDFGRRRRTRHDRGPARASSIRSHRQARFPLAMMPPVRRFRNEIFLLRSRQHHQFLMMPSCARRRTRRLLVCTTRAPGRRRTGLATAACVAGVGVVKAAPERRVHHGRNHHKQGQ